MTNGTEEPAIEVRGLRKHFGDVKALDGVDLVARRGTVLGVLGPNGAGKTTAVRVMTTLLKPDAGTARVAGLDVVADAEALRSRIGLAGQYAAVDENLTGSENLTMVGRLYGMPRADAKARAAELLADFGLADAADRIVKTYSGGMRRRLDLAAALVARPPIVFLDEPTTGLDPRSRIDLWETIESLVAEGATVLLTTQYLDEADRLADQIAVIDHGKVIAEGTAAELKDRVGGMRVEVHVAGDSDPSTAAEALAPMSRGAAREVDDQLVRVARTAAERHDHGGGAAARRRQRGRSTTSPSASRRSTTSSSPSPAASSSPRRRRTTRAARRWRREALHRRHPRPRRTQPVRLPRQPDLAIGFTIQPIMFVLLFAYVFGGAIVTPGFDYIDFLIPGIIVQNTAFGGFVTALGLSEDLNKGLIDRFRSLPTSRASVLAGRTAADLVTNGVSILVLLITGLIIGFSFQTGVPEVVGGFFLLLLYGYAFSWIFAVIGMSVSSPEAANGIGFTLIFPITFISSAFVPVDSMPSALQWFADVNPITIIVDAMRALWLGTPAGNNVWGAVVWSLVLIAIFAPIAVARYRKAASR